MVVLLNLAIFAIQIIEKMDSLRFKALETMASRSYPKPVLKDGKVSSYFGCDVFGKNQMKEYLSSEVYKKVMAAINDGTPIDRTIADQVAEGMKIWAIEKGATHYTHWFQPLNESTAEKHDAFLDPHLGEQSFEKFSGNMLAQQEPDASSFPSGGLRNTFEARGYSAWDPSSPAFITDKTLCIPSIFVAYTGEALDFKTPILRAMNAVDKAAVDVCRFFDKDVTKVVTTLGCEQEYFLVDEALFNARPDLIQTGRTLMGHTAAKDQQLEDHYWGAIPERVEDFMKDFEEECFRLGIPLMTRHNEVAPNQFECAPLFEECNVAIDHNILLMSIMRKVANRHHLKVLFHEKPFAGVNGSGKHCNWSLATNTGVNLLAPGKNPKTNTQFLAFFVCVLKACHDRGSLMMASVASAGNACRLGGNEAPPAILSVFAGATMNEMLDSIEKRLSKKLTTDQKTALKLHIGKIPEIMQDNTDRNRTSPFAFTGNRFEFRAPGSSTNCALPMIAILTAVTETLTEFKQAVDKLIEKGEKKDEAIFKVIRQFIVASKKVRFEGNGYSEEWLREAGDRGLRSMKMTEAFGEYLTEDNIKVFEKYHVLNRVELQARYEIKNETYLKKVQIESRVVEDIAKNHIVPTAIKYQNLLIENIKGLKEIFPDRYQQLAKNELEVLENISMLSGEIYESSLAMTDVRRRLNKIEDIVERAKCYEAEVVPMIDLIRGKIDRLEMVVDDEFWPLIKYRELLATLS